MNGLALTLILVFVILLLGLVYVIWNRRRFRRKSSARDDVVESSGVSSGIGRVLHPPLVKEVVLCFWCLKNQSRIEPAATSPNTTTASTVTVNPVFFKPPQPPAEEEEANDDDELEMEMEKLRHQSRLLYTINEEEEEEEEEKEGVEMKSEEVVESKVDDIQEEDELTSFSSACSSPLYSTPASSPPHVTSQTCFHSTVGNQ